jgi:AAHS family benzoate transporter-like MFS transporter
MTSAKMEHDPQREVLRRRTVTWVVLLASLGMIFDGYDLVVFGTVVSTFLRNPGEIGAVTPASAGALGSYALVGVLVGAIAAGAIGDIVGRRKILLVGYAWFSIWMAFTALTTSATVFGIGRFFTGIGIGALVAGTGALVSEIAPAGKKNLCNAISYSGVPLGSLLAALAGILLLGSIGWRGMFLIGALPIFILLPLAYFKMPESVPWLVSRGRVEEARAISMKTGVPMPEALPPAAAVDMNAPIVESPGKVGFAGLFDRQNVIPAVLIGFTSAAVLLISYALQTWLPELMLRAGFDTKGSLAFLLVLNGGAVVGALFGSRIADRFGPKIVTAIFLITGSAFIGLLIVPAPLPILLVFVALAGLGTSGTQILLYGFAANYFRTNVRAAAVAWVAGFGRLGGIGGPLVGGFMLAAGLGVMQIFLVLSGLAIIGVALILSVPKRRTTPRVVAVDPSLGDTDVVGSRDEEDRKDPGSPTSRLEATDV